MPAAALRPLSTSLIRGTVTVDSRTMTYEAVDIDQIAAEVFARIDAAQLADARAVIAKHFADAQTAWLMKPGTDEDLAAARAYFEAVMRESLASAYAYKGATQPLRAFPPPPLLRVTATAKALPERPTFDDLCKWTLAWQLEGSLAPQDSVGTELCADADDPGIAIADATPFELALLALLAAGEASAELANAIARATIQPRAIEPAVALEGPVADQMTLDIRQAPKMSVRATLIRNGMLAPEFVYSITSVSPPVTPVIDRAEEIDLGADLGTMIDAIATLQPDIVNVAFVSGDPPITLPVLIATRVNVDMLEEWKQTHGKENGRFVFDVTARNLRLRNLLV